MASALLLAAALLPGTASAAPERGLLVVAGPGNTTTELVLEEHVYLCRPVPTFTGGGAYAGVLIEEKDPQQGSGRKVGAVQVRAFADGSRDAVSPFAADGQLTPGTYRVTLFGQGPVRAQLSMCDTQAPGIEVAPRRSIPVQFLGRAETLAAGKSAASVHLPHSLPAGRRAVLVTLLQEGRVDAQSTCATTTRACEGPMPRVTLPSGSPVRPDSTAQLVAATRSVRSLHWAVDGVRTAPDRLRAAAVVF